MNRKMLLALVGAIVAVAAAVAVIVTATTNSGSGTESALVETAETVTVAGEAVSPFSPGDVTAQLGQLPTLTGTNPAGEQVTVDGKGGALVIVAAHWCPHCQRELPEIAEWQQNGSITIPIHVISTAQAEERGNWPPSSWLDGIGLDATVLVDDSNGTAASALGTTSFPYLLVTDSEGVVVARASGELSEQELVDLTSQAS